MIEGSTEAQWVCSALVKLIRNLSLQIRDMKDIPTEKVLALAKLTDSYEKIRKLANTNDNDDWDYEMNGDPHYVEKLQRESLERAERAKQNQSKRKRLVKRKAA